MRWALLSGRCPIGVDVDGRYINAVQLTRVGRGWQVDAAVSLRRASGRDAITADDVRRLGDVLARRGFRGRELVISVPREQVLTSVLELPPRDSGAPLDQISRGELAAAHKCAPDAVEADFWEIPKADRNTESTRVMAVGCRHDDANELLDLFERADLTVASLDTSACALSRAVRPLASLEGFTAVLNIGWSASTLFILTGDAVMFERELVGAGFAQLHDTLVEEIDLDADVADYLLTEAGLAETESDHTQAQLRKAVLERVDGFVEKITTEIRLSLTYVAQEYGEDQVKELLLTGEGATVPEVAHDLGDVCNVHTTVAAPLQLGRCRQNLIRECQSPVLTTAFGLAQYCGARRGSGRSCK